MKKPTRKADPPPEAKGEPVEQHPGVGAAISPRGRAKMEINLRYDNAT